MKKICLLFTIIAFLQCSKAQVGYVQNIAGIATIVFPAKPLFLDTLKQKVYALKVDSLSYSAAIIDPNTLNVGSWESELNELDKVYEGTINAYVRKMKGKLLQKRHLL
jgi:hypothetical protein